MAQVRGEIAEIRAEGVLRLELDRPALGNALDYPMMMALAEAVRQAADDPAVRAILIAGRGDDFCAGDTPDDRGPWPERFAHRRPEGSHGAAPIVEHHLLRALRAVPKPVVAVLRGRTLGLGLDLAAVCDFRIAGEDAQLGDPRILQARAAATGLTYVLPRLIGQSRATWMLLTGETMGAAEAHRIGLVHQLHPPETLEAEAAAFARKLAELPTRALALRKEMTLAQLDLAYEPALSHCLAVRQTNVIEDVHEGIAAWRERRPPRFTGR